MYLITNNSGGRGCNEPYRTVDYSEHNPSPLTPRGKRRHSQRNEGEQNYAKRAWNRGRATKPSRFQRQLQTGIRDTVRGSH